MTTQQTDWTIYTGSDEQIAQLDDAINTGYIVKWKHNNKESEVLTGIECSDVWEHSEFTHYWIIPDDPLREMKIRQAMTGQPVWVRECRSAGVKTRSFVYETTTPDWNIPNAEYSFTPF